MLRMLISSLRQNGLAAASFEAGALRPASWGFSASGFATTSDAQLAPAASSSKKSSSTSKSSTSKASTPKAPAPAKKERILSAYNLFVKKNFDAYKESNPQKQAKQAITDLAGKWKTMTDREKEPYQKEADKKKQAELNRRAAQPKKPLTAYNAFALGKLKELKAQNPDQKQVDIMRAVGAAWQKLSAQEKESYKPHAK